MDSKSLLSFNYFIEFFKSIYNHVGPLNLGALDKSKE